MCKYIVHSLHRSTDFRPSFARLHELRGLVRSGIPMLAVTATVTDKMCADIIDRLDMKGCMNVSVSLTYFIALGTIPPLNVILSP